MRILAVIAVATFLAACGQGSAAPARINFEEDLVIATLMEDCHAPYGWEQTAAQGAVFDCDAYLLNTSGDLDDGVRFIAAVDPARGLVLLAINDPSGMTTTWQELDVVGDYPRLSRVTDGQAYRDAAARFASYATQS